MNVNSHFLSVAHDMLYTKTMHYTIEMWTGIHFDISRKYHV